MTGRYAQRFGYEYNDNHLLGLPPGERTLGERMRDLGYATGYVGKWHLGWESAQRPHRRGFDELFGIEDSGSLHVDQDREGVESWSFGGKLPRRREKPVYRGDQPRPEAATQGDGAVLFSVFSALQRVARGPHHTPQPPSSTALALSPHRLLRLGLATPRSQPRGLAYLELTTPRSHLQGSETRLAYLRPIGRAKGKSLSLSAPTPKRRTLDANH